MRTLTHVFVFVILSVFVFAANLHPGFVEEQIANGLDPTAMRMMPDGRIFITEKKGTVRIIENDLLLDDPFVTFEVDNFNERGLGGIAIHPNFDMNGFIYFYYTVPGKDYNQIVRVTANGNYAIPGSEEIIFTIDKMNGNIHMGGDMHFGPDGKLYVSIGDGTNGVAPNQYNSLLGKVIRINDDGSIPQDNPFYGSTEGKYKAIWALGLRNSYSTAMHPVTGRFFGCDVGSEDWEEINDIVGGGYYGWAELEGKRTNEILPENYQDPLYSYDHSDGCAVIGATFYAPKSTDWPERYHDKFFFMDYCDGYIKVLNPVTAEIQETFATGIYRPLSLMTASNGDLYYISRGGIGDGSMRDNTSSNNGSIWRIKYTGSGAPFISLRPVDISVPKNENAIFSTQVKGDEILKYQWFENDTLIVGAIKDSLTIENVQLSQNGNYYHCEVYNDQGKVFTRKAILTVLDNTRPVATISSPRPNNTYVAGESLYFSGLAYDQEDGSINESNLSWHIDFHHDSHTHPALIDYQGNRDGTFTIPTIGEVDDNVWYRLYLIATDYEGLSSSTFIDIFPKKTTFKVQTDPPNLEINIDGRRTVSPEDVVSVVGLERTLAAPQSQFRDDTFFTFSHWNNIENSTEIFKFTAGEQSLFTAHYEVESLSIGNGTGLTADFYIGTDENDLQSQKPVLTRVDKVVDFNWEDNAPDPILPADNFMIRWRGELLAPISDLYTFKVASDDGIRLWVDNEIVINQWVDQAVTESTGFKTLEGGKRYRIRMDYYEKGGHAVAQLLYKTPRIPETIIPTSQLYPDPFDDINEDFDISIYPIPTRDFATVEMASWTYEKIKWTLYDSAGRRREGGEWQLLIGTNIFIIPMDGLTSGLYHLRVEGEEFSRAVFSIAKQ